MVRVRSIFIFNLVNIVCFSSLCLLHLCRQNEMLMWEKWTNPKWPRRKGELLCYFKRICNLICTHTTTGRDMRSCVSLWKLLPLHHIPVTHAWSCLTSSLSATVTVKIFAPAVCSLAIQHIVGWPSMIPYILISRDDSKGPLNLGY